MIENEELLATYTLLSYIRETLGIEKRDTLAYVFVPLVREGISAVFSANGFKEVKGKDFTEIQSHVNNLFKIVIPIPVLETIMPILSKEAGDAFQLNKDHSFIIKSIVGGSIMGDYSNQKRRITLLEKDYKRFCQGESVQPDFDGLISFIQDQKNRLFDKVNTTKIEDQSYHISKYINFLKNKKNAHYETVCDLYLGGIISSYLKFRVKRRIVDADLLIDTNFYTSLMDLNTEESYATCKQLYDITMAMGFRYKILETTIDQIKILLNSKLSEFNQKDVFTVLNDADILAACDRRGLSYSDLQAYKDGLLENLSKLGVTTLYKSNIPQLVNNVKKSRELKNLTSIRGNYESAFNDLLAEEYVGFKRTGVPITEFIDVNCWFLTNSYSTNKSELALPVCQRRRINAADLLVLLWYANPSLSIDNEKAMLAATSLGANVLRYRTEKLPTEKVITDLTNKIAKLQQSNLITEQSLAKLCIRMSEGCIDNTEAERLVTLTSAEFLDYVDKIQVQNAAYTDAQEKIDTLQEKLDESQLERYKERVRGEIWKRRTWAVVYVIIIIATYFIAASSLIDKIPNGFLRYSVHCVYWLALTFGLNWFSHSYFLDGIVSIFNYQRIFDKLMKKEITNKE